MSTPSSPPETRPTASQFEQYVERQLESTRQQVKLTEVTAGLLSLGLWVLGFLLAGVLVDSWLVQFGPTARLIVFLLLAAGAAWIAWTQVIVLFVRRIHRLYAARMIEEGSENFHNSLVNYLQVKEGGQVDREAVVQAISQRAARDLSKISATEKVDRSLPIKLGFGLVALVGLLVGYTLLSPKSPWPSIARILNPVSNISAPSIAEVVNVTPGSTAVFFGQKLLVTAEVRGRHNPDDVRLVYSTTDGQQVDVPRAMQPAGKGNAYQLELSTTPTGIDGPLFYYVIANDGRSPTYSVNVKPNPAITLQKFEVIPPTYTRLPPRTVEGQTEIEGLEGSQVKLTATANMPIQVAWLELLRQKTRGRETTYEVVRTIELRNQPTSSDESDLSLKTGSAQKFSAEGEFFLALDANRTGPLYTHYQMQFRTVDGERNPLVNVQPLKVRPDLAPVVNVIRPFDREVAVPLNRALEIELQAEDQDFEISRLQLLLDHQGGRLLDEEVELGDNRKQQRISANYRFEPRKLQLSVGDEVIFHARASDNRVAAMSGQPDPNVTRTENYSIKITEPLETEIAQDLPQQESNAGKSGKSSSRNASDNPAQAANQPAQSDSESATNPEQASEPSAGSPSSGRQPAQAGQTPEGDAESAMSEANPGQSSADQPKQNKPVEESATDQAQPTGSEEKQSEQQAEKAEQQNPPAEQKSSGDSAGGQQSSQASGSQGESSKQPAEGEGQNRDQQEQGNEGEASGDAQANPAAEEKQMGQGAQPNQSGDPAQSKQPGAQNPSQNAAAGKEKTPQSQAGEQTGAPQQPNQSQGDQQTGSGKQGGGQAQQAQQSAGNPDGGDQASRQNSGGENSGGENSGGENAGQGAESAPSQADTQNQSAGKQSPGKQDAGQENSGQKDAGKTDANQPGERDGESGTESTGQSGDAQAGQPEGEPSASNDEPLDKSATDAERFQRLQERLQRQRQSRENTAAQDPAQSSAEQNPNSSGDNQSGQNQPEQDPTGNQETGQPQSQNPNPEQSEPGKPTEKQGDQPAGQPQPGKQGDPKSAGNSANQAGKQDAPKDRPPTEQPSSEQSGDPADQQGSPQGGSGEPGKQQSGSSDKGQADKQGGAAEKSSQQSGQPGSSQQSGGQSDSESKQSSEAQQASSKQGGSGAQGNSQGKSQGSQSGQDSSNAGQPVGEKTGESGSSGNASGADSAQASQSEMSKRKDQPSGQQSSSGQTNPQGTGQAGSNAAPSQDYSNAAEQAEGNLDYSRKATDLVLDELRNQANKPDPELLKEMNWTEQDLKDFISRWEAMKQKAGSGATQERKRYEDALRSLGLRPEPVRRNIIKSRRDELNKLSEDGAVNRPPANLADEFNAFLKNRNRVQKNK